MKEGEFEQALGHDERSRTSKLSHLDDAWDPSQFFRPMQRVPQGYSVDEHHEDRVVRSLTKSNFPSGDCILSYRVEHCQMAHLLGIDFPHTCALN